VGRERELELLVDGFMRCKEGRGQAFSILAEAGVGKSRLLYEFRKVVANEDVTFLEGKCLSYSRGVAYYPVIDVLKSNFDIREGERDFEIRQKVKKGIKIIQAEEASTLPYLLELLLVKNGGVDEIPMNPEMRKARTLDALIRIVLKGSEIRPLIMAIEDLHWIDKSSEESFRQLLESISGARVLLIFTYRPEFVHTWGGRSYHSQLNLNRLSNRESLLMVTHLLGTSKIDPDLENLILDKTEGVPFFIEEFIESLKNMRLIESKEDKCHLTGKTQDLVLPSTIHDVIMARVDTLPEGAKEILLRGSVIGREFSHELIKEIIDIDEHELLSFLAALRDSELLYERGIYPACTYIFKHALTCEVIYESILTKKKKKLHRKIGKAIEKIQSERLEELYEILAYHYSNGENSEKAYQYLKLSGNKAVRNYANNDAFRYYRSAIELLTMMSQTEENKKEQIQVRLLILAPMFFLGYPEDSFEILQNGEKLSNELGDEESIIHFLSQMGQYYSFKGDNPLGVQYCEAAFKEAEKIDDIGLMVPIGSDLCLLYYRAGETFKIIDVARKVVALLDKTQRQSEFFGKPYNVYSVLFAHYARSMCQLGNFEEATVLAEKGINFALKIKDIAALAWLELDYGQIQVIKGEAKNAIEHLQNSIRYVKEAQMVFISGVPWFLLGWAHWLVGELETARECLEKGQKILNELGAHMYLSFFYALSGMVYLESGDLKNARYRAEDALKISQKEDNKWVKGFALILLGRIFGKAGKPQVDKAEECFLRGIKILEEFKFKPFYAQGLYFLGLLYADTGQQDRALENLKKAEKLFRDMGMDNWLTKTKGGLGNL
jgi:tetratricopeptide (TPR) repeat protein